MNLQETEKTLLAILIKELAVYRYENVIILDDGSIIMAKSKFKILNLTSPRKDFLTVVKDILSKLDEGKKDLVYASSLCAKAIAVLFTTNDRTAVVKLLFAAYLTEEDPEGLEGDNEEVEFKVANKTGGNSRVFRYPKGIRPAEILAQMIHEGNHVVFVEQ